MQTKQLSKSEIRERAAILASKLEQVNNFKMDEFNELTHALITDNGKESPGIVASNYETVLVEVMGLLMNPEVSKELSLQTQKQAGTLFNNLFKFFNSIEICENDIEKRCDYISLCYSGCLNDEELLNLEKKYAVEETV